MELNKSRKKALLIFSILFVVLFIVSGWGITRYLSQTITASEYISEKYRNDSIDIVTDTPSIGKDYIAKILTTSQIHNYSFEMGKSSYDDNLKAYKCEYKLISERVDRDGYRKYIHKCAWVHVDFNSNNGDYIITPRVIKVIKAVD